MTISVEEHTRRFFARHDVAQRQRRLAETDEHRIFGPGKDLQFEIVNLTNQTLVPGFSNTPDRVNDDIEIRISTPGHEWYLLPDWVDDLVAFLQKVQEGRKA